MTPDFSFRLVPTAADSQKKTVPMFVGIKNTGKRRVEISARGRPLIWNLAYDRVADEDTLNDLETIVIVQTHTVLDGEQYCPGEGDVLGLEAGQEILLNAVLDLSTLKDGIYSVRAGIVLMHLPEGRKDCVAARYVRGEATFTVQIRGERAVAAREKPARDRK